MDELKSLLGFNTAIRYNVLNIGLNVPIHQQIFPLIQCDTNYAYAASIGVFPKFNIPPVSLKYNADMPSARNVYTNIPVAYKELVKQKLYYLLSSGIIEEVTVDMDRSFCSSLLVIPKGKDDVQLVIDLRGPISTVDLKDAFFHIELEAGSCHLTNVFA